MLDINFDQKKFALLDNSKNGQVNSDTLFYYKQKGTLITAEYYGGSVAYGKIIALRKEDQLNMLYQCATTDGQLRAGEAIAEISLTAEGKIRLDLDWHWLNQEEAASGTSTYIEVD